MDLKQIIEQHRARVNKRTAMVRLSCALLSFCVVETHQSDSKGRLMPASHRQTWSVRRSHLLPILSVLFAWRVVWILPGRMIGRIQNLTNFGNLFTNQLFDALFQCDIGHATPLTAAAHANEYIIINHVE